MTDVLQYAPVVALSAGEASGDLLGAHLMQALRVRCPQVRFVGIGGPKMRALGMDCWHEQEALAVRGYVEVLRHLPRILAIRRDVVRRLLAAPPDVFVGIDAPDFNLGVAERVKQAGVRAVHYVSPSVWAWRQERVAKIVRQVDEVLCLFPMEPDLYTAGGGRARFVGHPLAQMLPEQPDRAAARRSLALADDAAVFVLMPGSRMSEVDYLAPVFLQAAALLRQSLPEAVFLLPYATPTTGERVREHIARGGFADLNVRLVHDATALCCTAADAVLVASGTATLEVALCQRPMVVAYKISPLTHAWVKRKIRVPFVSLPNVLLGRGAVPELLQDAATPEALAQALLAWYDHPEKVAQLQSDFADLHRLLHKDTAAEAAEAVLAHMGGVA